MSCDDLDRLRTSDPQSGSSAWSREARQHLGSCARCSKLQAVLESSSQVHFPDALRHRIEAAILPHLVPVSPLPGVLRVTVTLLLCSIVVIAAANWRLGSAGWYARGSLQTSVDFGLLSIGALALANLLAQQMEPGSRRGAAVWLFLATPLVALVAADASLFGDRSIPDFARAAFSCWTIGVICAAVSAPLFWLFLRRGFSLNPVAHCATAGLLAGLIGVTVLEIYCPILDRRHILASHVGAAVTALLAGAIVGGIKIRIWRSQP